MTIKELRERTGLSQRKFAEKFDIPLKTIQTWEFGASEPRPYIISMIVRILDFEDKYETNG